MVDNRPTPVGPDGWQAVQVRRRWQEGRDTLALVLVAPPGHRLAAFEAGAFVDVLLPGGALVRPYSLANPPHAGDHYLLAVRLETDGDGGSRAMHLLRPGDSLHVSTPRNGFPLQGGALHSVLLAGGIGIAPLLSMAGHLWRTAASFELHHGFRSPDHAAFAAMLRQAPYAHRVQHWCSAPGGRGRIDVAQVLGRAPRLSHIYLCGPRGFMEDAVTTAMRLGWPAGRLHQESFVPGGAPRA